MRRRGRLGGDDNGLQGAWVKIIVGTSTTDALDRSISVGA